jgi:hypothetical protein
MRRACLGPELVDKLLFLNGNHSVWNTILSVSGTDAYVEEIIQRVGKSHHMRYWNWNWNILCSILFLCTEMINEIYEGRWQMKHYLWIVVWVVMQCTLISEGHITLKMKVICSSKMLVTTYKTTWCQNPEDHNTHFHRHENLKSHIRSRICFLNLRKTDTGGSPIAWKMMAWKELVTLLYWSGIARTLSSFNAYPELRDSIDIHTKWLTCLVVNVH